MYSNTPRPHLIVTVFTVTDEDLPFLDLIPAESEVLSQ